MESAAGAGEEAAVAAVQEVVWSPAIYSTKFLGRKGTKLYWKYSIHHLQMEHTCKLLLFANLF